ncbi:GDP-L-fucose synthase [Pseudomonas sp. 57B-090624]|nr:GDP-L-fucose synthase [Pseudomonas sp. 57B-090624]
MRSLFLWRTDVLNSYADRIFIAGHNGMVGSAIVRHLQMLGYKNLITCSKAELDLRCQTSVSEFFRSEKIDQVYIAAAKVGGIYANDTYPADFIYDNLIIQSNIIHQAHLNGVQRLLFLGSSCIYPKMAEQPMREDSLLSGGLEPTNEPYAIAKIAGIKLCESYARQYGRDYRSVMPTNLYGPNDNFHPDNSHVIPALMRRIHEAKLANASNVLIWGSGTPMREFLHVDDMASACVYVMSSPDYWRHVSPRLSHINIGTGQDCSIRALAESISDVVGFSGGLCFDSSKPDGAPRKLLDVSRLNAMGWRSSISLRDGLLDTYQWFLQNTSTLRA